ncbi:MAG: ABC transporter permease [Nodosilinea sp. LVE1205-7]|jgi:lipopolysaccharide transport system permease protein
MELLIKTKRPSQVKGLLLSAWQYRYFILSSIKVEFKGRFARSRLGGLWVIIHPLIQAAIFALVLGQLLSGRLPGMANNKLAYPIYLLAGTLAWTLFTEVITRCLTVFIDNANLLKKLVFPKICLPLIVTGSALVNNVFLLGGILLIVMVMGFVPGINLIWIPVLTVVNLALALGIGLIMGTLNVFMRDIGQVVPVILQLSFWFTPIAYSANVLPGRIQSWAKLNPMYWVVQGYHNAILYNLPPSWVQLGWVSLLALALLVMAMGLFKRASSEIVDAL